MNESLNSNGLATYSSQQRGKSNFVKRIGGVYSIKSVVLRPDFSRISGCVLRRGAHTVLGWMMMMPNDRFGSSYLVFSIELSSCQSSWWWVFLVIITGKATYNLLASAAIQDLRADNVPSFARQLASFMVRKCNRKALFWSGFKPIRLPN